MKMSNGDGSVSQVLTRPMSVPAATSGGVDPVKQPPNRIDLPIYMLPGFSSCVKGEMERTYLSVNFPFVCSKLFICNTLS